MAGFKTLDDLPEELTGKKVLFASTSTCRWTVRRSPTTRD